MRRLSVPRYCCSDLKGCSSCERLQHDMGWSCNVACCCWSFSYSTILCSWADSLHSHGILHKWLAFYRTLKEKKLHWSIYSTDLADAAWNCCRLGIFCIHHTTMHCHFMQSHIGRVHACLAVSCHLHFWQNDQGLLCAPVITWGWNKYPDESAQKDDPGEENSPAAPAGTRTRNPSITRLVL